MSAMRRQSTPTIIHHWLNAGPAPLHQSYGTLTEEKEEWRDIFNMFNDSIELINLMFQLQNVIWTQQTSRKGLIKLNQERNRGGGGIGTVLCLSTKDILGLPMDYTPVSFSLTGW